MKVEFGGFGCLFINLCVASAVSMVPAMSAQSNRSDALKWGIAAGAAAGVVVYILAAGGGHQTMMYSTVVKPVNSVPVATVPAVGTTRASAIKVAARPTARTQMDAFPTDQSWGASSTSQVFPR